MITLFIFSAFQFLRKTRQLTVTLPFGSSIVSITSVILAAET